MSHDRVKKKVPARVRLLHVAAYFGGIPNGRTRDLKCFLNIKPNKSSSKCRWRHGLAKGRGRPRSRFRGVGAQTSNQLLTGVTVLRHTLTEHVPSGCVSLQTSIDPDALHIHKSSDMLLTPKKLEK